MGYLHSLEVENFKSFKGKHTIGPFKPFTAIIGPNGSGKSNLMDAISFVLGEKSQNLRVRKLGELIHGASVGKAVSTRCRVTLNYMINDETHKSFTRSVISTTASEFRVDGVVTTPTEYQKALEEIQIFIKAKNFLVYQGKVEQVAMQKATDLTQMFEELSRSSELQGEYNRLKAEMTKAEGAAQQNLNRRREIVQEKKEAKMEKDEAKRYQTLKDELSQKNQELYLVKLYFAEHSRKKANEQLGQLRGELERVRAIKKTHEDAVAAKQREVKEKFREAQKLEQRIQKEDRKIANQRPICAQLRQELSHIEKKKESAQKLLNTVQKTAEQREQEIKKAEKNMKDMEEQKLQLQEKLEQESQQMQLNLDEDQLNDYRRLKSEVEKQTVRMSSDLENKRLEQDTDRSTLEYEKRRLEQWEQKIKAKESEIEREKQNVEACKEQEQELQKLIETERAGLRNLEQEVKQAKARLEEATHELNDLNRQINDASGDSAETERTRRQNEAIDGLKRVFPDRVFGTILDLCQPSHKKYQIAITKVLAKHMYSVVCDTDDTARECIGYLREQRYHPLTFLPMKTLDVQPINEKLREINNPPGVKLIYDVINCNEPRIKKALQFVCGNALVCETPEHARTLAYGSDRYRAVALDGTQFQPNGVISGGGQDLKAKARKWDEQGVRRLKEKRSALQEECQSIHKNRPRELDVEMKRNAITQMENRLKHTRQEIKKLGGQGITRLENELDTMRGQMEQIEPRIQNKQEDMERRKKEIEKLELDKNHIEDKIFADFCRRVGIGHIREYEQRELRFHEEMQRKLGEYDVELDRLRNELDYLRSDNKNASVKREKEKIANLKKDHAKVEEKLNKEQDNLTTLEENLERLQEELRQRRAEVEKAEAAVAAVKKESQGIDRDAHNAEKRLTGLEQAEARRTQERHSLLHECKMNAIDLPLLSGSLDRIALNDDLSALDSQLPNTSGASSTQQLSYDGAEEIEIDYSSLKYAEKKMQDETEVNKIVEKIQKSVQEADAALNKMSAPNLKANERMEAVKEKEAETNEECETARKRARKAMLMFEKVKNERIQRFNDFFEPVSAKIDEIYKQLSQNQSAQAMLVPENMEEPYLEGVAYNCVAPGKRFRPMDNLSGGEKTIAALALLFAIHSSNPSPFFVLDEIDAALDNTNIGKVVSYVMERAQTDMQLIVISLKEELFNKADALIGVYPKHGGACMASGLLTYDLTGFDN